MKYIDKFFGPLFWIAGCITLFAIIAGLGGCSTPSAQGISPPPAYLMDPPRKFPRVRKGDDAVTKLAEAAEVSNRNQRQIKGLQGYIKKTRKE
jgi:hypothetical protein